MAAVLQFAADAKAAHGPPQQIYTRQIFGHLRLLQRCAEMEAKDEIDLFERVVPGGKSAATSWSTLTSTLAATAGSRPAQAMNS
jgi:hypothetical protein